jgi:SAM-dependent methyltransferase
MPKIGPFETHTERYDEWFETNRCAYESELQAVASMLPRSGLGVEVGVGTGRFAAPLGIKLGVEPSTSMAAVARQRGIDVIEAVAEDLPFANAMFDFVLLVTTLCFLDDAEASFLQASRVLRKGGSLTVGFVDRERRVVRLSQRRKAASLFYREIRFYSVDEVICLLENAGFGEFDCAQTLFHELHRLKAPERVRPGHGQGSFVVLRGTKPPNQPRVTSL